MNDSPVFDKLIVNNSHDYYRLEIHMAQIFITTEPLTFDRRHYLFEYMMEK